MWRFLCLQIIILLNGNYMFRSNASPLTTSDVSFAQNHTDDIHNESLRKFFIAEVARSRPRSPRDMYWFRIQFKTLKDHDLVTEFVDDLFPIDEEYVWFSEDFLINFGWVNESKIAEEEVFMLKGARDFMLSPFETHRIQDFYLDQNYDLRRFLTQTSTNAYCSRQIKELELLSLLKIESHERKEVFLAFSNLYRSYAHGSFGELELISFNGLPNEILNINLIINRQLLDYHYTMPSERNLLAYNEPKEIIDAKKSRYSAILSLDLRHYLYRVGRFSRFVESIYLLHLSVLNKKTNDYYMPYRLVHANHSDQNEHTYYAIPKEKLRETFRIAEGDNGYLSIFNRVEGETSHANETWISNQLLNYLKALNHSINEDELKKISHQEMMVKMCQIENGLATRLISLFIAIDYSPFTQDQVLYQYSFNSKLLLRWTCFSLSKDFCTQRTKISIACAYLLKNYPVKEYPTRFEPFKPSKFVNLSNGEISIADQSEIETREDFATDNSTSSANSESESNLLETTSIHNLLNTQNDSIVNSNLNSNDNDTFTISSSASSF